MHVTFDYVIFVMSQKLYMNIKIIKRTSMRFALLIHYFVPVKTLLFILCNTAFLFIYIYLLIVLSYLTQNYEKRNTIKYKAYVVKECIYSAVKLSWPYRDSLRQTVTISKSML